MSDTNTKQPIYITAPKNFKFSIDDSNVGVTVIPPLTCATQLQLGDKFKTVHPSFKLSKDIVLPDNWNNFTIDKNDTEMMKHLKNNSIRPVNQGLCGSCYAVAIATTISDNFLFAMKLDRNPSLSPMYILSCLPDNAKCGGANPTLVLDDIIEKGGIPTNCSQDYYKICTNSQYCNGKGEKHLDKPTDKKESSKTPEEQMEEMIPTCGYCAGDIPKMYKIKNKTLFSDKSTKNSDYVKILKNHIMNYGAAIGAFIVYANFVHADRTEDKYKLFSSTKGIYINRVNYVKDPKVNPTDELGGHAISIVGWGVEKDVTAIIDGVTYIYPKVEYWVCRNSWTANWGENGYFKYALYQKYDTVEKDGKTINFPDINKNVAFETDNTSVNGDVYAGILTVEPDVIVDATKNEPIYNKTVCNPNYTCSVSNGMPGVKMISYAFENKMNYFVYGCIAIIVLVCVYYLFFKSVKKITRRRR